MRDIFHNLIRNNDHSYSYDDKRYGKTYKSNKFSTIGHVDFQYYYNLFYTDNASKIVPPNIADILTPISLAILGGTNQLRTNYYNTLAEKIIHISKII